ncbi:DUF1772 domain-containing protein [Euzebya tangerina]|uniref:anthrone oxygenase family protein n=1 Tax=Euzebya tangerina TaxID=591198 RepID=UPI000E319C7F|nr:anthrone oxygenase family protein [Euzebya tangerina]
MTGPSEGSLVAATLLTGLDAGIMLAFANSVMPGLRGATDDAFVDVMVGINEQIQNPLFFAIFIGGPMSQGVALALRGGWGPATGLLVSGVMASLAKLALTAVLHVPANTALATSGRRPGAATAGLRSAFETRWVSWHRVRTALSVTAFLATAATAWASAP